MARSYPSPDAFPGMRPDGWTYGGTNPNTPAWALDREPDDRDYDVPPDPAVAATVTPGNKGLAGGSLPAPNPFPGYPGTQPGGGSGSGGAYGHSAGDAHESTRPGYAPMVGEHTVLPDPNPFPGGNQIPAGVPDSTGTNGQVPRLRRDPSAGTMP